eukprot:gene13233-9079_t
MNKLYTGVCTGTVRDVMGRHGPHSHSIGGTIPVQPSCQLVISDHTLSLCYWFLSPFVVVNAPIIRRKRCTGRDGRRGMGGGVQVHRPVEHVGGPSFVIVSLARCPPSLVDVLDSIRWALVEEHEKKIILGLYRHSTLRMSASPPVSSPVYNILRCIFINKQRTLHNIWAIEIINNTNVGRLQKIAKQATRHTGEWTVLTFRLVFLLDDNHRRNGLGHTSPLLLPLSLSFSLSLSVLLWDVWRFYSFFSSYLPAGAHINLVSTRH